MTLKPFHDFHVTCSFCDTGASTNIIHQHVVHVGFWQLDTKPGAGEKYQTITVLRRPMISEIITSKTFWWKLLGRAVGGFVGRKFTRRWPWVLVWTNLNDMKIGKSHVVVSKCQTQYWQNDKDWLTSRYWQIVLIWIHKVEAGLARAALLLSRFCWFWDN